MYNYDNPHYRAKVWANIKFGAVFAAILILLSVLFSCGDKSEQERASELKAADELDNKLLDSLIAVTNATNKSADSTQRQPVITPDQGKAPFSKFAEGRH